MATPVYKRTKRKSAGHPNPGPGGSGHPDAPDLPGQGGGGSWMPYTNEFSPDPSMYQKTLAARRAPAPREKVPEASSKEYLNDLLKADATKKTYTGFLPSRDEYRKELDAKIQEILGQVGAGKEAFGADLAARGISGSGEGVKALYRDVYAPIAKSATATAAESQLDYAQAYQKGRIAEEGAHGEAVNRALGLRGIESQETIAEMGITSQEKMQGIQNEFDSIMLDKKLSFEEKKYKWISIMEARLRAMKIHSDEKIAKWKIKAELAMSKEALWGSIAGSIGKIGAGIAIAVSDIRLKQDVEDMDSGVEDIRQLRPVTFKWKSDPDGRTEYGLIAQELEKVLPDLVGNLQSDSDLKGIAYQGMIPVLIKAIQELSVEIEELKAQKDG